MPTPADDRRPHEHLAEVFGCPLCGDRFGLRDDRTLVCPAGHAFDVAREGYVNLVPAQAKHSKEPGYNRELMASRHAFFATGGYAGVAETMADLIAQVVDPASARVLDAGCGEGYYLRVIRDRVGLSDLVGTDLSKPGVRTGARLDPGTAFAVANSYQLPMATASVDLIVSHFSPVPLDEFARVLRPDGWLLLGSPGADHLFSLKAKVYRTPRRHSETAHDLQDSRFARRERRVSRYRLAIPDRATRQTLFSMTPYAYGSTAWEALEAADEDVFSTDVHVLFDLYRRRS